MKFFALLVLECLSLLCQIQCQYFDPRYFLPYANPPPVAFYRRNSMTHDRETIGSSGGAPIKLFHNRQAPFGNTNSPIRSWLPRSSPKYNFYNNMPVLSRNVLPEFQRVDSIEQSNIRRPINSTSNSQLPNIIKLLFKTQSGVNFRPKIISLGLGIGLGATLGTSLVRELNGHK
ncbi:uncharacterized protein [Parasteatoda tepidariorum]|uniref:uncharacterized protein n=1 Tax=Parasteatoda tepidariorum TaxID=114398 RepID=UPI00077FA1F5|nr:uncharacterized protein LOC107456937 [Parasteatoda tepidariorum]